MDQTSPERPQVMHWSSVTVLCSPERRTFWTSTPGAMIPPGTPFGILTPQSPLSSLHGQTTTTPSSGNPEPLSHAVQIESK